MLVPRRRWTKGGGGRGGDRTWVGEFRAQAARRAIDSARFRTETREKERPHTLSGAATSARQGCRHEKSGRGCASDDGRKRERRISVLVN